ncbi:hypothetical protein [Selenomonas ruminantium]|nr:hypothetical protein [Selenomonas ruminantium]
MKNMKITLLPLQVDDREQFIRDNQEAFNYGARVYPEGMFRFEKKLP